MQQRTKTPSKKRSPTPPRKAQPAGGRANKFAEELAVRVRAALGESGSLGEKKMFGGIGFMLNGNLVVAASRRGLLVRSGKDRQPEVLAWPNSRPMVMRGRTMEGYAYLDPPGASDGAVRACVGIARTFVATLPKK